MAKRKPEPASEGGTIVIDAEPGDPIADPIAAGDAGALTEIPPPADGVRHVMLECPLKRSTGYAGSSTLNVKARHALALKDLANGLRAEGATVAGRPIKNGEDALAWILESFLVAKG